MNTLKGNSVQLGKEEGAKSKEQKDGSGMNRMPGWKKTETRDKGKNKFDIEIKDTFDLIEKIENNELPDKIMINVHPQRWNDAFIPWMSELVRQSVKNVIKRYLIKLRD